MLIFSGDNVYFKDFFLMREGVSILIKCIVGSFIVS